ncbi:hypothetical protein Sala_2565 [Sphingopyxis alaskensis RB2256]|uniref:Uncharacterized protein n=1 Tax=Sphingopyxis alaskensis (strain DSM 13593 / LMG 18877 / RB2256) TaxID=317655 RepID=Q1GQ01_SPHAL|nr:hypothetical protein Sala_2565 [Sphingopyxis alaskensis RB2256]
MLLAKRDRLTHFFFPSHRLKRTADEGISEGHARRPRWANGHEGALVLVGNLQCRVETLLDGAIRGCVHNEAAHYLRGHFLPSFSRLILVLLITAFDRSAGCRMALPMLFQ